MGLYDVLAKFLVNHQVAHYFVVLFNQKFIVRLQGGGHSTLYALKLILHFQIFILFLLHLHSSSFDRLFAVLKFIILFLPRSLKFSLLIL
jgi:uncharacterized membrane protein